MGCVVQAETANFYSITSKAIQPVGSLLRPWIDWRGIYAEPIGRLAGLLEHFGAGD